MTAPRFTLVEAQRFEWPFRLRMPFRFGVVTVTQGRQAVLRARIRLEDGTEHWGIAAESLVAKWFDKDPALSDAQNEHQLRRALEIAEAATLAAGANTAFGHFADTYAEVAAAAAREKLNPLVASYGRALLDRAMLDALLKARGASFWRGMRANIGGMAPHAVVPDLPGFDFGAMLASLRHCRAPCAAHGRAGGPDHRGRPVRACGGRAAGDARRGRLRLPAPLLEAEGGRRCGRGCRAPVAHRLRPRPAAWRLPRLARRERAVRGRGGRARAVARDGGGAAPGHAVPVHPLHRAAGEARPRAGDRDAGACLRAAVIIDESDGPLDAFVTARGLGYAGVSSKSCKGVWRSLVNLARCRAWNAAEGRDRHFMSAEDLTTLAGVCVQQDLALVALLGLPHVERNGHHFVDGFAGRPKAEAVRFMEAHPDLYADTPRGPRLRIAEGVLEIGSLDTPGLGAAIEPDLGAMEAMPRAVWS
jgi:hypothetical protein